MGRRVQNLLVLDFTFPYGEISGGVTLSTLPSVLPMEKHSWLWAGRRNPVFSTQPFSFLLDFLPFSKAAWANLVAQFCLNEGLQRSLVEMWTNPLGYSPNHILHSVYVSKGNILLSMCLSCMYYFAFVSELGKEKTELLFIICTLTPTLETNKATQ